MKLEKCEFDVDETTFLGYVISKNGLSMDKETAQWYIDGIKSSMRGALLKGKKLELNDAEKD